MPIHRLNLCILLLYLVSTACFSQRKDSSVLGVFVASTPCNEGTKPLPGIPANEGCELIKWKLTLYKDKSGKTSDVYELQYSFGLAKQGTHGFVNGGRQAQMKGTWRIVQGTPSDHNAIVYQPLDLETKGTISFLKLNDNLLHLLDTDGNLMIGSAAWSFTVNRTNQ